MHDLATRSDTAVIGWGDVNHLAHIHLLLFAMPDFRELVWQPICDDLEIVSEDGSFYAIDHDGGVWEYLYKPE